jgi:hypothetical protein
MKWVGAVLRWTGRAIANGAWWLLGIWTVLAAHFTAPGPAWLSYVVVVAVVVLYALAQRERFRFFRWGSTAWRDKRFSTFSLLFSALYAVYYFGFIRPDNSQVWSLEQDRKPVVSIERDTVNVKNVRNFTWRSDADFDMGWYERTYDLSKLDSMYYVVASLPHWEAVAHVFVCFAFSDGQHVAISVEGHRLKGRPYGAVSSMFRQFQLIYIIGDERDVVGLRGAIWKDPVYFYPARTTNERKRALFVDMITRAHSLEDHPEFYNLIVNNCMNNITYHLRRLGGRPLPSDLELLLTGMSDQAAYRLGYIDTDLPFEKARQVFRVDKWMQHTPLDEDFSQRLRDLIKVREAEEKAELATSSGR